MTIELLCEERHPTLKSAEQEVECPVMSPECKVLLFTLEGVVGEFNGNGEGEHRVYEAVELYHENNNEIIAGAQITDHSGYSLILSQMIPIL